MLREVVDLVRFMDVLPVINHPSELGHGEVRGERESGPTQTKSQVSEINGTSDDTTPGETRLTAL